MDSDRARLLAATSRRGRTWRSVVDTATGRSRLDPRARRAAAVRARVSSARRDDLPTGRVSNVVALAALLPVHLQYVCATVSAPTFTADTRAAHAAFRSTKVAVAAQRFFSDIQIGPGATGLSARVLPSSAASHWRWKDVRPEERPGLWQYHGAMLLCSAKSPLSSVRTLSTASLQDTYARGEEAAV